MRLKNFRLPIFIFLVIIFFSLMSCTAEETRPTLAPVLDTSTPPPTTTVQQLPATSITTPPTTSYPTPSPYPPPGAGRLLVFDDFSSSDKWNTITTENGSNVSLSNNKITISIEEPKSYIFSLRNSPTLGDFYAEIDAHPTLCKTDDSYGFIFRSNGTSSYRYALTCEGTVRVELREIFESPLVIQEAYPSIDVPRDIPRDVRLGVWVVGKEMRFYLDGWYQFTVVDDQLSEDGSIGVFAETALENNAMTVSFSDLTILSVRYVRMAPTTMATRVSAPTSTESP